MAQPFLIAQIVNLLLIVIYISLTLFSFWHLRTHPQDGMATVLWALIVLLVPFLGAVGYLIVHFRRPVPR